MCSVAEFSTIWPTAGGQQFYTQALATGKTRPFLSYVVGWAVLFREISMGSSCSLNSASIIQSFVEVTHPDFDWPAWSTWLVYSVFKLFLNNSGYESNGWVFIMSLYTPIFGFLGTNTAASRLAWSMARDRAFPFSAFFAHISARFGVPIHAMAGSWPSI